MFLRFVFQTFRLSVFFGKLLIHLRELIQCLCVIDHCLTLGCAPDLAHVLVVCSSSFGKDGFEEV